MRNKKAQPDYLSNSLRLVKTMVAPAWEACNNAMTGKLDWGLCLAGVSCCGAIRLLDPDLLAFQRLGIEALFPKGALYWWYFGTLHLLPFWTWGLVSLGQKKKLTTRLGKLLVCADLMNRLGQVPDFVSDTRVDDAVRKLTLSRRNLPIERFKKAQSSIADGLGVYIDEIRGAREEGTVEIIYASKPMPKTTYLPEIRKIGNNKFVVGHTRSGTIKVSLKDTPHLLVAGQTGGGKSTFLRQFITTLFVNNPGYRFCLIDLKGGLEFQTFEKIARIKVSGDLSCAVSSIKQAESELDRRMTLLRKKGCKDIDHYMAKYKDSSPLPRFVIVVDEVAELFLVRQGGKSSPITEARRALSKIARQGRSAGVHLVVATQRPDSRALDPQIKANLTGVVCFKMVNDVSSIAVLGVGRASDLPTVPGRAIWKGETDMIEVQTPLFEISDAEPLLAAHRNSKPTLKPQYPKS